MFQGAELSDFPTLGIVASAAFQKVAVHHQTPLRIPYTESCGCIMLIADVTWSTEY